MNKESLRKLCAIHLLLEMICKGKDTIMIKNRGGKYDKIYNRINN